MESLEALEDVLVTMVPVEVKQAALGPLKETGSVDRVPLGEGGVELSGLLALADSTPDIGSLARGSEITGYP